MNLSEVQPLYTNIWVRPLKDPEQTKGGIVLPQEVQERTFRAEVVAVGDGYLQDDGTFRPLRVQVGDQVIYAKFAGTSMSFDGEEFLLINERDVYAIVKKGESNG